MSGSRSKMELREFWGANQEATAALAAENADLAHALQKSLEHLTAMERENAMMRRMVLDFVSKRPGVNGAGTSRSEGMLTWADNSADQNGAERSRSRDK